MQVPLAEQRFRPMPFELFSASYMAEIRELARHSKRSDFPDILRRFENYQEFLSRRADGTDRADLVLKASSGTGVVDLCGSKDKGIRAALATAHLAACCHLLHGSSLSLSQLQPKQLTALAQNFLETCKSQPEEYRARVLGKVHTMDAMRAIQVVRALGLLIRPVSDIYQLGIGAADGTRDVLSIHMEPSIQVINKGGDSLYQFAANRAVAAETIIVDLDERYREHYEGLNKDASLNVRAYNMGTLDALNRIPKDVQHGRNLVTGLRIDHHMIPDVAEFMECLTPCLDDEADLLLTIGAGDNAEEYEGRIDKFRELFTYLSRAGMRPFLFKLHGPGSPAKQRHSLKIGNLHASSYQILYCSLRRDKLE